MVSFFVKKKKRKLLESKSLSLITGNAGSILENKRTVMTVNCGDGDGDDDDVGEEGKRRIRRKVLTPA